MDIINYFQIPNGAQYRILDKNRFIEAVYTAEDPLYPRGFKYLTADDVREFASDIDLSNHILVCKRKGCFGSIQRLHCLQNNFIVKHNYVVSSKEGVILHSVVNHDEFGNISYIVFDGKGRKNKQYEWVNPLSYLRENRRFTKGFAGKIQKLASKISQDANGCEVNGTKLKIAEYLYKLVQRVH